MVLACNVCGSYNKVHICREANYEMVETSLGRKKKKAKDDEEEFVFGQQQDDDEDEVDIFQLKRVAPNTPSPKKASLKRVAPNTPSPKKASLKRVAPSTPSPKKASLKRPAPAKTSRKRKKEEKEEEESAAPPACMLYQKVCVEALTTINELDLPPDLEQKIQALYKATFFSVGDANEERSKKRAQRDPDLLSTRTSVPYFPAKDEKGRVYGGHLQGLSSGYRRLLCHSVYHDIDMANAQPSLFPQVIAKVIGPELVPDILTEYALNREDVFDRVRADPGYDNATQKQLKKLFILCMTTAPKTELRHNGQISPTLSKYKAAVDSMSNLLSQMTQFEEELALASETKTNKMGKFISYLCARAERSVLFALKGFFEETDYIIGCLIHDGLLVERKEASGNKCLADSVIADAVNHIKEQTGFSVVLVEKSLRPTPEDLAILNGPKCLQKIKTDFLRCVYLLSRAAKLHKLKRMDENVYRPHPTIPGVYVPGEQHLEFANKTLLTSPFFMSVKSDDLVTWMKTKDHQHFELLCLSKFANVIAFRNGCFDLESLQFNRYVRNSVGEWTLENGKPAPMTIQFFDRAFTPNEQNLPTPLWDHLISTQIKARSTCKVCAKPGKFSVKKPVEEKAAEQKVVEEEEDEKEQDEDNKCTSYCAEHAPEEREALVLAGADIFEILIGRLLYPLKTHDNWQIMLFMKGDSNSGKSTVLNIITKMFPDGSVGCISTSTEERFGLQSLFNKRLVLFPDMSEGIAKYLPKETWQSMVSGEKVSIAIKNKGALTDRPWLVPMASASNGFPGWKDTGGAVQRRLGCFLWSQPIKDRDDTLEQRIIANELVSILVRCAISYRAACVRFTGGDFWGKVAPSTLQKAKELIVQHSSPLSAFLINGNDYYSISFEEGSNVTLEEFERAYSNHCAYVLKYHPKDCKLGDDRYPFTERGYVVKEMNKCRLCTAIPGNSKACGSHFNGGKNRKKAMCVMNMRIKNKGQIS